jgi:hypothetical protein
MPRRFNASQTALSDFAGRNLRKFPRRLGQFPLSFPAKSRWAPRSSGEFRSGHTTPLVHLPINKKVKGDGPLHKPVAFNASPSSEGYSSSDCPWALSAPLSFILRLSLSNEVVEISYSI